MKFLPANYVSLLFKIQKNVLNAMHSFAANAFKIIIIKQTQINVQIVCLRMIIISKVTLTD